MRRPVSFVLALSCLLAVTGLRPALYGMPQQKPTFRTGVDVVLLDVNVVDSSHKPVADLKPEDFVVSVDRKPRKVVSAEFVRYDVRTSTTTTREAAPLPGAERPTRPPARNVLIVVDGDSLEPGDGVLARREAAKFLDRLAPDDRIGVVTIPRVQSVVTMTRNRDEVKAALAKVITGSERYRPMEFNIGVAEALDIERGDNDLAAKVVRRECPDPRDLHCPDEVRMEIRQVQLQTHLRGQRALDALRDLGRSLSTVQGPKTMVLVTGGAPPPDVTSMSAYSDAAAALATGQVTLYTLYIRQELLAASNGKPSPTAIRDMDFEREGVENATSAAGGTFIDAVGTFDQYFERVVTELSGAYLLGIEVQASDRDGRTHNVSVKVNGKGLEVRGRKQYVIEPEGKRASGSTKAASPPVPATGGQPNGARALATTSPELQPLLERAGQYAQGYHDSLLALLWEEFADFRLSKRDDSQLVWGLAAARRLGSETLLRTRPGGWDLVRDVFEVDGRAVRPRDGRLRTMFLEEPETIIERAAAINATSVSHEIGFVNRSTNVVVAPLVFLNQENRQHFVFARQGESVVAGVPVVQMAFDERGEPSFATSQDGRVPVSGQMWVDPRDGAVLKTLVRWEADGTAAEVTVTYGKATDGSMWAPADMSELYTARTERLECVTKFGNYRRYETQRENR